jgi:hypothetical protein
MISLNFDDAILDGTTSAAALLELGRQRGERGCVQGQPGDHGDALAAAPGLAPDPDVAVTNDAVLIGSATTPPQRFATLGAGAAKFGRVDQSCRSANHAAQRRAWAPGRMLVTTESTEGKHRREGARGRDSTRRRVASAESRRAPTAPPAAAPPGRGCGRGGKSTRHARRRRTPDCYSGSPATTLVRHALTSR